MSKKFFIIFVFLIASVFPVSALAEISVEQIKQIDRNIGQQLEKVMPFSPALVNQFGGNVKVDLFFDSATGSRVDVGNVFVSVPAGALDIADLPAQIGVHIVPVPLSKDRQEVKDAQADGLFPVVDFSLIVGIDGLDGNGPIFLTKKANVEVTVKNEFINDFNAVKNNLKIFTLTPDEVNNKLTVSPVVSEIFPETGETVLTFQTRGPGNFAISGLAEQPVVIPGDIPVQNPPLADVKPDLYSSSTNDSLIIDSQVETVGDLLNSIPENDVEKLAQDIISSTGEKYQLPSPEACIQSQFKDACLIAVNEMLPQLKPLANESDNVRQTVVAMESFKLFANPTDFSVLKEVIPALVSDIANIAADKVVKAAETTAKSTEEFVKSPAGQTTVAVTRPVGVVSGGVFVGTQIATSSITVTSLSDLYLLILKFFGFISGIFGRKKKNWGTVFDSVTKRPLDPAYVVVKKGNDEAADAITDLDGRFGFLLPSGSYALEAQKTNYIFPSKVLSGKKSDILYENLYFGEKFSSGEGDIIAKSIPLDPTTFDWNEFQKDKQKLFRLYSRKERVWAGFFNIVYMVGILASLLAAIFNPSALNIIFVGIYALFFVYQIFWLPGRRAVSLLKPNGEAIPFAIIKIFSSDLNKQVKSVVSDQLGRFYFLVGPGKYYLTVDEKVSDGSYKQILKTDTLDLKKGIVTENLVVSDLK
jgi:hypothetical protein